MLLSGSRDKTLIIWNLTRDEQNYGYPKRSLHGHSHIVSDCVRSTSYVAYGLRRLANSTRSFPQMVPTHSPHPGIKPSAFGSSRPVQPLAASSVTITMFSPSHSLPTIAKSYLARAIVPSSCGIHWATANTPLQIKAIPSGCRASDSAQTPRTR